MNKNTLTAIFMGLVICLGIVVIVLSIKLGIRPKTDDVESGVPTNTVVAEEVEIVTPTPIITQAPPEPQTEIIIVKMVRAKETINIRSQASKEGAKLGSAVVGSEYVMIEQLDNGWTKIEYNEGEAYLKSEYLEVFEVEKEVEVVPESENEEETVEGTENADDITE